ncbi:hypothetical protein KY284_018644 [Solanum tuberosum]|nr:hypothetical protein KY284_018644 [Solanum tuberosum]
MKLLSPKIKQKGKKGYVRRICVVSEEGKVDVKEVMVHSSKDDLLRLTVKNPISSSSLKKYVTWVEGPSESVSLPSQKGRGKVGTHYPPHTPTCGTTLALMKASANDPIEFSGKSEYQAVTWTLTPFGSIVLREIWHCELIGYSLRVLINTLVLLLKSVSKESPAELRCLDLFYQLLSFQFLSRREVPRRSRVDIRGQGQQHLADLPVPILLFGCELCFAEFPGDWPGVVCGSCDLLCPAIILHRNNNYKINEGSILFWNNHTITRDNLIVTDNVNLAHFNDKIVTIRRDIMKFRISQSLAVVGKLMIGVLWTFRVYPSGKLLSDMGEPDPGTCSEVAKGSSVFDQAVID